MRNLLSYVSRVNIPRLFLTLTLTLTLCTCSIPVLLTESSSEAELLNSLFQPRTKFEDKFVTIKGTDEGEKGFEHKLETYLNRVLFSHAPNKVQYWINYIMGMGMNIYESFFEMSGRRLHYEIGKINTERDYVILALEDGNRIQYKAFHVLNLRKEKSGEEERLRLKSEKFQKRLEEKLKIAFKDRINKHLNELQSERGEQKLTLDSADIFKIDLTLYERLTKDDRRGGEYYRDLVEMIAMNPDDVGDSSLIGPTQFKLIGDYKDSRSQIWEEDPVTFPRRKSILEGGGEEAEAPDQAECELMQKIRSENPRLKDILSWMHEEGGGRLTDADSVTAGTTGLMRILVHNFLELYKDIPIAQLPEAAFHGFAHGALQGLFVKRFGMDIRVEYRTGKGYVDMLVLYRSKNRLTNAIPAFIEIKDASKEGMAKKGMEQIEDDGYAYMRPDIRTAAEHAALVAVSFHSDEAQRIEAGIGRFEETPTRNFAETIVNMLDQLPARGPVIGPDERPFAQITEEIRKAICYHSHKSYRTSADYINRIFFGEELDCADALEDGSQLTKLLFHEKFRGVEKVIYVFDAPNHPAIKLEILQKIPTTNMNLRSGGQADVRNLPSMYSDRTVAERLQTVLPEGGLIQQHFDGQGAKDMISISIELHPEEAKFKNYLPEGSVQIRKGSTNDIHYVTPLSLPDQEYSKLEEKVLQRGQSAGQFIKNVVEAASGERPTTAELTIIRQALEAKLDGFGKFMTTEELAHGVMDGWLDSARDEEGLRYRIFSEFSAGPGKGDLLVRKEKALGQDGWTDVIVLIELKQVMIPAFANRTPQKRLEVIEERIFEETEKLKNGHNQAKIYAGDIKHTTDSGEVAITTIGFFVGRSSYAVNAGVKLIGARIMHSSINTAGCTPIASMALRRSKRSTGAIKCWEDVRDVTEGTVEEIREQLQERILDKEGLLKYIEGVQDSKKAALIDIYRRLQYRNVPKAILDSSPCGNRLPSSGCLDEFNADLSSERDAGEAIDSLFDRLFSHPTGSDHSEHAAGPASLPKPIWMDERVFAPIIAKLHLLEKPAVYVNHALFAIDLLSKMDDIIVRHDFLPAAKTGLGMVVYQITVEMGYYMEKVYNDYGMLIKMLVEYELSEGFGAAAHDTLYSLTKISLMATTGLIPNTLRVLPVSALNIFEAGLSAKRIYEATQMPGIDGAAKLYLELVEGCNIVAKLGQVTVAISAQVELEPAIMLIQITCGVGSYVGGRFLLIMHLSDDIDIGFWEKVRAYLPIFNNLEELQNNHRIKIIYEGILLPNGSFPVQFDAVIRTLPHVVVFDDGKTCSEVQLNDTSQFLFDEKMQLGEDFGFYLMYPHTAEAHIVDSVDNETTCTASVSRTLVKIGSALPEVRIFCAPTGKNAEKKPMPELVCDGQAASYFSVPNIASEKKTDAAERNYCSHTIGLFNGNGTTGMHIYDVRARSNASTIAGDGDNLIFFYDNSFVAGGKRGSNRIYLVDTPFNASRIRLEATAVNTLILNCQNFTAPDARSQPGSRVSVLLGSANCSQDIHVSPSADYVYTGGNTTLHVRSEPHSSVHIEASAGDYIDLSQCEGVIFLDVEEEGQGKKSRKKRARGQKAVTIVLPKLYTMMLSHRVHIRLVGEGDATKFDIFERQHVLNRYNYFYNDGVLTVALANEGTAFLKLHTHHDLHPIRLDVSLDTWLVIFPSPAGGTPCVDVHYKMAGNPDIFEWDDFYYEKVARHLASTGNLPCMRAYAEDREATIVVHKIFLPLRIALDFAHNGNKTMTKMQLRGERNVIFVEHCREVVVQLDLLEHQNYSVYLAKGGAQIGDVFKRDNSLVVSYACPKKLSSTITFRDFYPSMFGDKHVTIYSEAEVRQIDALDTFPDNSFSEKSLPAGPNWVRERVFHFHDGSVDGRLTLIDVEHLEKVFIPDTYVLDEITFLRSDNSLVLYKNNSQKLLGLHNFFSPHLSARAQSIQLVLRNERAGMQRAHRAEGARRFTMQMTKEYMKSRISSGEANWERVEGNYSAHLKGVGKVVFFDVQAHLSNVTLTGTEDLGGTVVVGHGNNNITLHGWNTVTAQFRPMFLFQRSDYIALDITGFKSTEVANMRSVLGQLRYWAGLE